ncbi:MAG: hypothetical protein COB17_02420 [Sulfurimonas sp.]|nr:MAG: hypothetical protein COB17_02420 [Sulfurimonas sp.]
MHTQKETLIILDCSKMTLSRYVQDGKLGRVKKGRKTFYDEHEVASLVREIENKKNKYRPDLPKKEKQKIELPPGIEETLKNINAYDELDTVGHLCLSEATQALRKFGLYKECDKEILVFYALSSQMVQRYLYSANKHDSISISDTGMITTHPHHRIMMDYQKLMITYSDRLGLNPLARTKFEIKEKKEPSEMEKLLNS